MELKEAVKNRVALGKRPRLIENVLLIEGIARAGKFLLANCLCAINDVEHTCSNGLLDNIPFMVKFKLLTPEAAEALIQNIIDNSGYDIMIGRNLNFRYDDKSCIYNSPRLKEYLDRSLNSDRDVIVEQIKNKRRYFMHIVHQGFPNIEIFLRMYSKIKVIRIERHPVDLVYSWFQRGFGRRLGRDARLFIIPIQGIKGPIPWFAHEWAEDYENSSEMDRVIRFLYYINEKSKEAYVNLNMEDKKKIHTVSYERLLTETDEEMKKISIFLDKKILPGIELVKARERIPAPNPALVRNKKMNFIKKQTTPKIFSALMAMENGYEK
ncbi:MAG: sulfotransferase domain-containing protein [Candidatus Omnitrophota bacterium]|nr:MAG: sulfotransferase domain-containing protein [Candidatus Omnitrophota bacterium]